MSKNYQGVHGIARSTVNIKICLFTQGLRQEASVVKTKTKSKTAR